MAALAVAALPAAAVATLAVAAFPSPAVATLAVAGLPSAAGAQDRPERAADRRGMSRWAYVDRPTAVRVRPSAGSRRVGRVALRTFLGSPETVLELRRVHGWVRVRYPGLGPRTGWVRARALAPATVSTQRVVVDRATQRLTLYDHGRRVRSYRVGVGAPDSPTPAGRTYVRERVVPEDPRGRYGPVAFGLAAYSAYRTDWPGGGQVGVHGTDQPWLIPGRVSNGCIRLDNADVRRLAARLTVGTPVRIR